MTGLAGLMDGFELAGSPIETEWVLRMGLEILGDVRACDASTWGPTPPLRVQLFFFQESRVSSIDQPLNKFNDTERPTGEGGQADRSTVMVGEPMSDNIHSVIFKHSDCKHLRN
jgi:hypothetical protein